MELKGHNVQHARNLFDSAITLLPCVDQLWYKYVYLEELLGNVPGARQVFKCWLQWDPDDKATTGAAEQAKLDKAQEVLQTAPEFFGDDEEQIEQAQAVFNAFAKMETCLQEYERA
ncbi:hypothetical protein C8Q78DRAFT_1084085 [Trametes maxima]|nr:hypothetical protein C8Q78DRAFT_1084085 [Trametes maxima]